MEEAAIFQGVPIAFLCFLLYTIKNGTVQPEE
jgi:hypothetical protein